MSATVESPSRTSASASPSAQPSANAIPRQRGWKKAINVVPNLAVFSLLAGVFYLGHEYHWKLPKLSELAGSSAPAVDDWCSDHLVPESQCIECRIDLLPKSDPVGFCREHGVAECVIHHPELAQVSGELQLPKYDTVQAIALIPRPANNSRNALHTRRVQFTSAESVAKAGIEVNVVQERPMTDAVAANGELVFDPTRVAHLSTRAPGTVAGVFKKVGDQVLAGEILALVDANLVGQAKAQLVQAIVQLQLRRTTVERLQSIGASGALPLKSVIEAESARQEAEVAFASAVQSLANLGFDVPASLDSAEPSQLVEDLRFLDVPEALVASLPGGSKTSNLIPVRAPHGGMIVAANVVVGEVIESTEMLFTLSDPTRMWLLLNVRQEDARHVRLGLPVRFQSDDGGPEVAGEVGWVSPAVDGRTRTLQVRVAIANAEGALRDQTFGSGQIILRHEPHAMAAPLESVQSTSDAHFVFVRDRNYFDDDSPKFFHVRQVRLGARDDQFVELLAGVLPGEVVATRGSNVLLAQLLRSNLGAGCGCHEP